MATQPDPKYTLTGRITNSQGEPLEGLVVRAYHQDPITPSAPLGEQVLTDAQGRYKISFTEKVFEVGGVESGGPDVFFRVYDGDEMLRESPVKTCGGVEGHCRPEFSDVWPRTAAVRGFRPLQDTRQRTGAGRRFIHHLRYATGREDLV